MEDKDCCTYACDQGRNCPVRATRRVRAGQPAPPILIDQDDYTERELPPWKAGVFVAGIIAVIGLLALGWVAVL
jgi:hypothetical protein